MDDVAARTRGRVAANGIELAYETFGDPGAPPAVLIMGLATQMIAWPDELCEGRCGRSSSIRSRCWPHWPTTTGRRVCGGPGR
jgi:hypothetical protein